MLAIIKVMFSFRTFIWNTTVQVFSNNAYLTYHSFTLNTQTQRQNLVLVDFDFLLTHIKKIQNQIKVLSPDFNNSKILILIKKQINFNI